MKRLFIAINLPEEVKNKIEEIIDDLRNYESAIRWLSPENWHLTISFLGYQPDEVIDPVLKAMKETGKNFPAPTIEFEKIIWAPPNKTPRMIWLTATKETSKSLEEIKKYLEDLLIKNGVRFRIENRPFNAHLTLARFQPMTRKEADRAWTDADKILRESALALRSSALSFQAQTLDLMESHLRRTGAEYEVLTSVDF